MTICCILTTDLQARQELGCNPWPIVNRLQHLQHSGSADCCSECQDADVRCGERVTRGAGVCPVWSEVWGHSMVQRLCHCDPDPDTWYHRHHNPSLTRDETSHSRLSHQGEVICSFNNSVLTSSARPRENFSQQTSRGAYLQKFQFSSCLICGVFKNDNRRNLV